MSESIARTGADVHSSPMSESMRELVLTSTRHRMRNKAVNSLVQVGSSASPPTKGRPLLVWLHGLFECGHSKSHLSRLKKAPGHLPGLMGKVPQLESFVVLSPQCPPRAWWKGEVVVGLVSEAVEQLAALGIVIDLDRISVLGVSMGGFGVWTALAAAPNYFAAGVPMCGAANPWTSPMLSTALLLWSTAAGEEVESLVDARGFEACASVPLWAFHGAWDPVVSPSAARRAVTAVSEAGSTVAKITVYPNVGHMCWFRALQSDELFEWLLVQRKERGGAPVKSAMSAEEDSVGMTPSSTELFPDA